MDQTLTAFCGGEYHRLVGLLSLYCGDRYLAEELAQETIVRVVRDWAQVQRLNAPTAWTYRVAMNLANSHLRRRLAERRARQRLSVRTTQSRLDPDTTMAVMVRQAVAGLPKRERSVIVLRYFADLSVRDVSELLGYPEGTVKTLTARALLSLRTTDLRDVREVSDAI